MLRKSNTNKSPIPLFNSVLLLRPLSFSEEDEDFHSSIDSNQTKSNSTSDKHQSPSSTEKNTPDNSFQKCLLPGLLQRLDQCSPASPKAVTLEQYLNAKEYVPSWQTFKTKGRKLFMEEEDKTLNKNNNLLIKNKNDNNDKRINKEEEEEFEFVLYKKKGYNKEEKRKVRGKKKYKKQFNEREGDWFCSQCKNINFSFRTHCNICKMSKAKSEYVYKQKEIEYFGK